jgi:hypothetical protein
MRIDDFNKYLQPKDLNNPLSDLYQLEGGETFYIEPPFHTQLMGLKELRAKEYPQIIEEMLRIVRKNKKVVFTGNYEEPQTEAEGYIYLEVTDITDPLLIFVEDKSRGSDYGD